MGYNSGFKGLISNVTGYDLHYPDSISCWEIKVCRHQLFCICVVRLLFVLLYYCLFVNVYCHRVTTQLQLNKYIISYIKTVFRSVLVPNHPACSVFARGCFLGIKLPYCETWHSLLLNSDAYRNLISTSTNAWIPRCLRMISRSFLLICFMCLAFLCICCTIHQRY